MTITNERIKELRQKNGYTLARIAEILEVTEATAQRYESGKGIKSIPYRIIEKYANIFKCTPQYLMGWDEEEIEAASEVQKEADNFYDHIEAERKEVIDDIINLQLTKDELLQVLDYAGFIKSRRK